MEFEKTQQQVWQRVFSGPEIRREDLKPLLLVAMEAAAVYQVLAASLTGGSRDKARALYQIQSETVACLRGLMYLSGAADTAGKALISPKEPARRLLEKAYYRAKRAMTEYTARSLDSDFGVVFQNLARQEAENCVKIAQLLGALSGEKRPG